MVFLWLVKHQTETGREKAFSLELEKKTQHIDFWDFFFINSS